MSKYPKGRPRLAPADVRKIAHSKLEPVKAGQVAVVAIRGYYEDSLGVPGRNDRGIYDDAIFVLLHDRTIAFNGNTDPSAFRRGIATLIPGVWRMIPGKHKINSPTGYAAFRQFGDVTVRRDEVSGLHTGYFGINLHRGGEEGTSSEGCQTVPPRQWNEFRDTILKALGVTVGQCLSQPGGITGKDFPYLLVTKDDAENIIGREI